MTTRRGSFRWGAGALLRVSTDPGGLDLPEELDLYGTDGAARGVEWLTTVLADEHVRAVLSVASPSLITAIDALIACHEPEARRVRRAVVAVASYLVRWQRRATPFGLFAGVGLARIGSGTQVRWGSAHRMAVRQAGRRVAR